LCDEVLALRKTVEILCALGLQVHFIIRHTNPKGGVEEKHLKLPPLVEQDKGTHVYTAILKSDNT
jgi:calnexin